MECKFTNVFELEYKSNFVIVNGFYKFHVSGVTDERFIELVKKDVCIVSVDCINITNESLEKFGVIDSIVNLSVKNAKLTDGCFRFFSEMVNLDSLSLYNNKNIFGLNLSILKNIKMLDLSYTSVDCKTLIEIAKMRNVKICLDNTHITYKDLIGFKLDATITIISKGYFTNLQLINVKRNQIFSNLCEEIINVEVISKTKNRIMEFFMYVTKWEEYYIHNSTKDISFSYISDIYDEYIYGFSRNYLNVNPYTQGRYSNRKIIAIEKYISNIRVYTIDLNNSFLISRFTLNEDFKIICCEDLDLSWAEVQI